MSEVSPMNKVPKFAYDRWHERINSSAEDNNPMAFPWYRTAFSGIQNHLSGQLPWIRSWRNCNGAGKPSKTSSRDAPCCVHEKGGKNNSSRLGDTTLAFPDNAFDWIEVANA
jgi:hypothetical protein